MQHRNAMADASMRCTLSATNTDTASHGTLWTNPSFPRNDATSDRAFDGGVTKAAADPATDEHCLHSPMHHDSRHRNAEEHKTDSKHVASNYDRLCTIQDTLCREISRKALLLSDGKLDFVREIRMQQLTQTRPATWNTSTHPTPAAAMAMADTKWQTSVTSAI